MSEKYYMNIYTGAVDTYDGWEYEDEDGEIVNAVDLGEVEPVHRDNEGNWVCDGAWPL